MTKTVLLATVAFGLIAASFTPAPDQERFARNEYNPTVTAMSESHGNAFKTADSEFRRNTFAASDFRENAFKTAMSEFRGNAFASRAAALVTMA